MIFQHIKIHIHMHLCLVVWLRICLKAMELESFGFLIARLDYLSGDMGYDLENFFVGAMSTKPRPSPFSSSFSSLGHSLASSPFSYGIIQHRMISHSRWVFHLLTHSYDILQALYDIILTYSSILSIIRIFSKWTRFILYVCFLNREKIKQPRFKQ